MELCVWKATWHIRHIPFQAVQVTGLQTSDRSLQSLAIWGRKIEASQIFLFSSTMTHGVDPSWSSIFCSRCAHYWLKSFTTFYSKWSLNLSVSLRLRGHQGTFKARCRSPWMHFTGHWSMTSPEWDIRWGAADPESSLVGGEPRWGLACAVQWDPRSSCVLGSPCPCVLFDTVEHHGVCLRTSCN